MKHYGFNFWQRWLCGFAIMVPITCISSCMVGFLLAGAPLQGVVVWFGEAALFGFAIALCPTAAVFEKPWWDRNP
jgi:uncharacterized membrane protein YhaH (DUF805 family)